MPARSDANKPQYRVELDPSVYSAAYVPGSRKAEEDAAIEAILQRVPAEHRAALRADLNDPTHFMGASTDPVIAQHLSVIASIRQADARARYEAHAAEERELLRDRVRVRVALVPSLQEPGARAVVTRRTDDGGVPLLLLPEATVTSTDLARGLHAAKVAYHRYGASAPRNTKLVLRTKGGPSASTRETTDWAPYLAELRGRDLRAIPGVGPARLMEILYRGPSGVGSQ